MGQNTCLRELMCTLVRQHSSLGGESRSIFRQRSFRDVRGRCIERGYPFRHRFQQASPTHFRPDGRSCLESVQSQFSSAIRGALSCFEPTDLACTAVLFLCLRERLSWNRLASPGSRRICGTRLETGGGRRRQCHRSVAGRNRLGASGVERGSGASLRRIVRPLESA